MRGFPVNGDPKPAELSRPPENPPPKLGYRCAQGRRLDLVDNCFWYLGDIGALANVRFAPKAVVLIGATTLIGKCGLTIGDHPHH
jgi:hypothetical protein